MEPDKAGDRCDGGLRCAVRGLTAQLAAPQGFTLSIAGTLAATIGQRGGSDLFDVWLFVAGAGLSFCLLVVLTGGARRANPRPTVPVSRAAVLNVLPVVVVPAAVCCAALVPPRPLGFLAAGGLAAALYVTLLGVTTMLGAGCTSR